MKLDKKHPLYQEDLTNILAAIDVQRLSNKSFLITGATGLIGTLLVDVLMRLNEDGSDINIYAVGRNKDRAASRLGEYYESSHFHFIEQDVRMPFPAMLHVDFVIPLASNTHPLAYSQYPVETVEINVRGAEHALQKALDCGATILYPSTVEVYGNARGEDVFTEDYTGQLNLSTSRACYTESKRVSEALCQSYIAEHGVDVRIVRLSRIFGPTMLESDSKASSQFIKNALTGENIVLKSKGEQYYSYTYAADAVGAMLHVLLFGEKGVPYNIANSKSNVHLKDFAMSCAQWANRKVIFDLPSETERKGFSVAQQAILDSKRLEDIGWRPQYDFTNALTRTLEMLK